MTFFIFPGTFWSLVTFKSVERCIISVQTRQYDKGRLAHLPLGIVHLSAGRPSFFVKETVVEKSLSEIALERPLTSFECLQTGMSHKACLIRACLDSVFENGWLHEPDIVRCFLGQLTSDADSQNKAVETPGKFWLIHLMHKCGGGGRMTRLSYDEYLSRAYWKYFAAKTKVEIPFCQLCRSPGPLHVHHNNYDNLWHESREDVIVLCGKCHKEYHNK